MDNLETLLEELERFEKKGGDGTSKVLDEYMQHVAKTGDTLFPWHRIRYFMRFMLATVMNDFYENCGSEDVSECGNVPAFSYVSTRDKILHHFDTFSGAPFTIQRLCEIMIDPTRHYKRTDKFLRGLEKNILVVSNIEPGRQRRSEDPQLTLVNGMQDGGLHTSPISGSSRVSSPLHQPKRIPSPQPTNSISSNANDFYDGELHAGESHVSGSEANGMQDDPSIESLAESVEPPTKKARTEMSHLQEKDAATYMSISEAESLEAEGSDDTSSSSSSTKTEDEAMETAEAEATCHNEEEEEEETTTCGHEVGTSESQELDNGDDDDALDEEIPVPAEACSSDTHATEVSLNVCSESSDSATPNQGSPDSVEDTSEQSQSQPHKKEACRSERAGTSEATAAEFEGADEEKDEVSSQEEEPDKDSSHEADSTSQASQSICSPVTASTVGSSTSVTSCTSPSMASTSAAATSSAISPVASPPSDTGGPTTSQISVSASSSPVAASVSTASHEDSSVEKTVSVDASTTSSLSDLEAENDVVSNNASTESIDAEVSSEDTTDKTNVSCSSSLTNKSDVTEEPMEED